MLECLAIKLFGNKSDEELLNNRHKNRGHNTSALYK
jgi:hypothetical protein